jgi:hypothetical protein
MDLFTVTVRSKKFATDVFLRGISAVYLCAFTSLYVQIPGRSLFVSEYYNLFLGVRGLKARNDVIASYCWALFSYYNFHNFPAFSSFCR